MFKILLELLGFYLLYKLIFDFIIPVYQTSKQVSKKMNDVQQKVNQFHQQQQQQSNSFQQKENPKPQPKNQNEDYIDYEEVR